MAVTLWQVFDLLLVLGMTLRLVRLVTTDYLGVWFIQQPAEHWAVMEYPHPVPTCEDCDRDEILMGLGWRGKLVVGLDCPWCIGFWIGCAVLASLWLVGGPGSAWEPWRWVAGALTLNVIAAHLAGDV